MALSIAQRFALAASAALTLAATPAPETLWYSIATADGTQIGHATTEVTPRPNGRETVDSHDILVRQPGHSPAHLVERTVTREEAGRIVSIHTRRRSGSRGGWTEMEARIAPGRAEVTRRHGEDRRTVTVALPEGVRFDAGEGLIASWDPAATPLLAFDNFNLDAMAVERVTIEAAPGAVRGANGHIEILRKRFDGSELRSIARLVVDREGNTLSSAQAMFGSAIHVQRTDRAAALRRPVPYEILTGAMVRSPFRIPGSAARGRIRYRFAYRDNIAFALPQTGEQRATSSSLDICNDCGPGLPTDAPYLDAARRPTVWLQSDDPRLRAIARPVASMAVSDSRKMELLVQRTRPYVERVDFTGHYSALETLSRRSGDCTEAAVLLAALGRAAGIPTRVAAGLVYSRADYHGVSNAFMPHAWVLAYVDGTWRSYDAAFEGFDSTHFALTIGDGDSRSIAAANQLAGLVEFQSMAEIRSRPAR